MNLFDLTLPVNVDGNLGMDPVESRATGAMLTQEYRSAQPFPHIVLDGILPQAVLRQALDNFPAEPLKSDRVFSTVLVLATLLASLVPHVACAQTGRGAPETWTRLELQPADEFVHELKDHSGRVDTDANQQQTYTVVDRLYRRSTQPSPGDQGKLRVLIRDCVEQRGTLVVLGLDDVVKETVPFDMKGLGGHTANVICRRGFAALDAASVSRSGWTVLEVNQQGSHRAVKKNSGHARQVSGGPAYWAVSRMFDAETSSVYLGKSYVPVSDCRAKKGKVFTVDANDKLLGDTFFDFEKQRGAGAFAAEICRQGALREAAGGAAELVAPPNN